MFGLLLLYFAGKAYYDLAGQYDKHQWGIAILGVVSYYAGLLLGGIIVVIIGEIVSPGFVDDSSDLMVSLLAIPFGILTCWGLYQILKRVWSKPKEITRETLDAGLISPEQPSDRYTQNER